MLALSIKLVIGQRGGRAMGSLPKIATVLEQEILPFLGTALREPLRRLPEQIKDDLLEIRLRLGQPVMLVLSSGDLSLPGISGLSRNVLEETLHLLTQSSFYAREEELRQGFITLAGGHRVGIVGRAILEGEHIRTLKHIGSLNIRLARQVVGAADAVLPYLVTEGAFLSTLIVSAPGCGKTTLLRDLIRQVSSGVPSLGLAGHKVGVVDERSEIAACYQGVPQNNVGPRTDVLDGAGKAEGIVLLLRSMSPQVIATDEVGSRADIVALEEALVSGVRIIATAHGAGLHDLKERPFLRELIGRHLFSRIVCLGTARGPGTLEAVFDGVQLTPVADLRNKKGKEIPDGPETRRCPTIGLRHREHWLPHRT